MNLDVIDEVLITVGGRLCNITNILSISDTVISCVPPQSGSGTLNIVVSVLYNLTV